MKHHTIPLDTLCADVLLAAKGLATALQASPELWSAPNLQALRKAGRALTEESPLAETYTQHLDTVRRILESLLDAETTGYSRYFHGTDDLEVGQVGTVVEERILTHRGKAVDRLLHRLTHLVYLNDVLWARVSAERHLAQALGE